MPFVLLRPKGKQSIHQCLEGLSMVSLGYKLLCAPSPEAFTDAFIADAANDGVILDSAETLEYFAAFLKQLNQLQKEAVARKPKKTAPRKKLTLENVGEFIGLAKAALARDCAKTRKTTAEKKKAATKARTTKQRKVKA